MDNDFSIKKLIRAACRKFISKGGKEVKLKNEKHAKFYSEKGVVITPDVLEFLENACILYIAFEGKLLFYRYIFH